MPQAYLRLIQQFRLRPLESPAALDQAIAMIDTLICRREPLRPEEEEYLAVLSDLVEQYEDEHEAIPDVTAAQMLRSLIEDHGVTQQTVARATGIAGSTISAVLKGDRELTRRHIERVSAYFGVEPSVFLPAR